MTGYVLIADNQIKQLALPNLRIVRGKQLFLPNLQKANVTYGFTVLNNALVTLDLRNFRFLENGPVLINSNPYLCHFRNIDWMQILGPEFASKVKNHDSFEGCSKFWTLIIFHVSIRLHACAGVLMPWYTWGRSLPAPSSCLYASRHVNMLR